MTAKTLKKVMMKTKATPELIERVKHNLKAMPLQQIAWQLKISQTVVSKIKNGWYDNRKNLTTDNN